MERAIRKEITVAAPVGQVWEAWTTQTGVTTFFAPQANVELAIGGEVFEWNAPPRVPNGRRERTWVVVQFEPRPRDTTSVGLTHLGWREGEEWDQVYAYFTRAWQIVLGRLERRFAAGPIDWDDPYAPSPECWLGRDV